MLRKYRHPASLDQINEPFLTSTFKANKIMIWVRYHTKWVLNLGDYKFERSKKKTHKRSTKKTQAIHKKKQDANVATWLVRSTPDPAIRVRDLAGDIVLCSWARHFTLTVTLSIQVCKLVPAHLILWITLRWTSFLSRESRNIPTRFMLQKPGWAPAWWVTSLVTELITRIAGFTEGSATGVGDVLHVSIQLFSYQIMA